MPRGLYVETRVRTDRALLWERTQDPRQHQRWDLRFTRIEHLPPESGRPQRFTYAIRLPWREVAGVGESLGERSRPDGQSTSALRFASDDPLSPIRSGRGWWRYVPDGDRIRFLTGYDYDVRWGIAGPVVDRLILRPWMGWATAWSFDRLRIWCEDGVAPERSRTAALVNAGVRLAVVSACTARGRHRLLALTLAALVPPPRSVPRARRCLRRPPDTLGRTAPELTHTLESS